MNKTARYIAILTTAVVTAGCGADTLFLAIGLASRPTTFSIEMTGDQEVPPVETDAMGSATFTLNAARTELAYEIHATGFASGFTVSHFYNAAVGESGHVVYAVADSLTQEGDEVSGAGVWPLREVDLQELLAGRISLNIHTFDHRTGEIRGQLILPTE